MADETEQEFVADLEKALHALDLEFKQEATLKELTMVTVILTKIVTYHNEEIEKMSKLLSGLLAKLN